MTHFTEIHFVLLFARVLTSIIQAIFSGTGEMGRGGSMGDPKLAAGFADGAFDRTGEVLLHKCGRGGCSFSSVWQLCGEVSAQTHHCTKYVFQLTWGSN